MTRIVLIFLVLIAPPLTAQDSSPASEQAKQNQPFFFSVRKIIDDLAFSGNPLPAADKAALLGAIANSDAAKTKDLLDTYCLLAVTINPESRVKLSAGKAKPELFEQGWKAMLIKVENQARVTATLSLSSPQALKPFDGGERLYGMDYHGKGSQVNAQQIEDRWLDLTIGDSSENKLQLSGLKTQYAVMHCYSRDYGKRFARFFADAGPGTEDLSNRNQCDILFDCKPAKTLTLNIADENGAPATASLTITDSIGHVYPYQLKRLAPDFFFQKQIYRTSGETIRLPEGDYTISYSRGPEYRTLEKKIQLRNDQSVDLKLERWISPENFGYYSGDHHIHAAGCSHYTSPSQGVDPTAIFRHIAGEALDVGSVLTWGSGYDHQKQFFEGKDNALSSQNHLMRYDLEISGFPSSHGGHLVLLNLKDQYYPGAKSIEDWPTYTLPILKWAKTQGAVTGYAHTGFGLNTTSATLPNYEIPKFDSIGANEYLVAVTQGLVDFISAIDTPPTWELNLWYHALNCGFRTPIAGETDFPCITDQRIGQGRSYVKVPGKLTFDAWVRGLKAGKSYASDGKSHIFDFAANGLEIGDNGSELELGEPAKINVKAKVSAWLADKPNPDVKPLDLNGNIWMQKPFWDIERARVGDSRNVSAELVVNGKAVASQEIRADGTLQDISFEYEIGQSSWVAIRILPSSHTNPIFVLVGDKPVRASKKSAEWCTGAVEACWKTRSAQIGEKERPEAETAYATAAAVFRKIAKESKQQ